MHGSDKSVSKDPILSVDEAHDSHHWANAMRNTAAPRDTATRCTRLLEVEFFGFGCGLWSAVRGSTHSSVLPFAFPAAPRSPLVRTEMGRDDRRFWCVDVRRSMLLLRVLALELEKRGLAPSEFVDCQCFGAQQTLLASKMSILIQGRGAIAVKVVALFASILSKS